MISNDDILKVARSEFGELNPQFLSPQVFIRFAHRIAAMQREIDAGIAEGGSFLHDEAPDAKFGRACAAAIRREQT